MSEKDKQRLYERISAHLDGASDAPGEIERLIRTDADAARLYAELSRLSAGMRSLPAPDVHPAFATRVMAHVREERDADAAAPAWRQVLPKILGAMAAAALIAVAVWPFWPDRGITARTERDPIVAEVLRLRNQPDQELAALFGPLAQGPGNDAEWTGAVDGDVDVASAAGPALDDVAEIAGKVASLIDTGDGLDDDADVFAAIGSLNEQQAEALRALLAGYAEGGSELL